MTKSNAHHRTKVAIGTVGHLLGISVLSAVFLSFFLNSSTLELALNGLGDSQLQFGVVAPLLWTVGVSALLWVGGFFVIKRLSRRNDEMILRPTGAVMTETLIILPVFFLLTMGLAQLGQRSMAGLLSTLAVYQSARTLALWGPEVGNNRLEDGPVTEDQATDRARIAAAMVLAPVGSLLLSQQDCANSAEMTGVIKGMQFALGGVVAPDVKVSTWSFAEAWGDSSFAARGPDEIAVGVLPSRG